MTPETMASFSLFWMVLRFSFNGRRKRKDNCLTHDCWLVWEDLLKTVSPKRSFHAKPKWNFRVSWLVLFIFLHRFVLFFSFSSINQCHRFDANIRQQEGAISDLEESYLSDVVCWNLERAMEGSTPHRPPRWPCLDRMPLDTPWRQENGDFCYSFQKDSFQKD